MKYYSIRLQLNEPDPLGLVLAKLSAFPFEGILEENLEITGYFPENLLTQEIKEEIKLSLGTEVKTIQFNEIEQKNWNEEWEKGFKEVMVDDFCQIRASFHPKSPDVKHSICIDPKMAFGTGHHETTFMMIQAMQKVNFIGNRVFDFGCGTGVLAILAHLMGSIYTIGIDHSADAIENSIENASQNKADEIIWSSSDIERIEERHFDVILANINRKVLLDYMPLIFEKLVSEGIVLFSGILDQDEQIIMDRISEVGLKLLEKNQKGDWLCLLCTKPI